ncbi:MAG: hypothetical protein ABI597_02040 [Gammaproteobacteria bacterium]
MSFIDKRSDVASLTKKIKKLRVKNINDLVTIEVLSEAIFNEWVKLKIKYQKNLIRNSSNKRRQYFKYEAEVEIIFGLMFLLNEKITNSIMATVNNDKDETIK